MTHSAICIVALLAKGLTISSVAVRASHSRKAAVAEEMCV